jgi:hypothetical protein
MVVVDLHLSGHILHRGDNPNEKKDFVYLEEHFKHVPNDKFRADENTTRLEPSLSLTY